MIKRITTDRTAVFCCFSVVDAASPVRAKREGATTPIRDVVHAHPGPPSRSKCPASCASSFLPAPLSKNKLQDEEQQLLNESNARKKRKEEVTRVMWDGNIATATAARQAALQKQINTPRTAQRTGPISNIGPQVPGRGGAGGPPKGGGAMPPLPPGNPPPPPPPPDEEGQEGDAPPPPPPPPR